MTVKTSQNHIDLENEGEAELVLVAVTYIGDRSVFRDTAAQNQGNWPSYGSFSPGATQIALLPDRSLGWWESNANFDVDYSPEGIAEAFLEKNFLAPEVFGNRITPEVQDRVLDKLGMDYVPRNEAEIRKELAEIAGVDQDEAVEDVNEESDFESQLAGEAYTRSELKDACAELRDSPDDISLNGGKTDFAEFLAGLVRDGEYEQSEVLSVIGDE